MLTRPQCPLEFGRVYFFLDTQKEATHDPAGVSLVLFPPDFERLDGQKDWTLSATCGIIYLEFTWNLPKVYGLRSAVRLVHQVSNHGWLRQRTAIVSGLRSGEAFRLQAAVIVSLAVQCRTQKTFHLGT